MDRLNQLRGEAGTSRDSTLDTSSPPSEAFMTANESSSKYFSLSEVDSTFDISPIKDVSLTTSTMDTERTINEADRLISNLSPIGKKNDFLDSYKIGKQIEAANILSGGVDIFDDNDNSYDGDELVIDDNVEGEEKSNTDIKHADSQETTLLDSEPVSTKDTEVILQIDGKNVDAIDIGNGLYLYRKDGEEELAAVQIDEDQQQPSFKFLKVRENDEGNLEVYEEFQIEVPKEVPVKEGKRSDKKVAHVPIKDINKVISDIAINKVERKTKKQIDQLPTVANDVDKDSNKDQIDSKSEINGKLMKFSDSRKSPVVGSFTPMTYHSTPNKEGIPLTKTMVDLQLHPNRHSDNVKKTIEVHTDNAKPKSDQQIKIIKESEDNIKPNESTIDSNNKCSVSDQSIKNMEEEVNVKIDETEKSIDKEENKEPLKQDELCNTDNIIETESSEELHVSESQSKSEPIEGFSKSSLKHTKLTEEEPITEKLDNEKSTTIKENKDSEGNNSINQREFETSKSDVASDEKINDSEDLENKTVHLEKDSKKEEEKAVCKPNSTIILDQRVEGETDTTSVTNDENIKLGTSNEITDPVVEDKKSFGEENITEKSKIESNEKDIKILEHLPNVDTSSGVPGEINKSSIIETTSKTEENYSQPVQEKVKIEKTIETHNVKPDQAENISTTKNETDLSSTTKEEIKTTSLKPTKAETEVPPCIGSNEEKDEASQDSKSLTVQNVTQNKDSMADKKVLPIVITNADPNLLSNNQAAVPFGKWTEANRQAFLNRIKETKVHSNSSNGKQIKNSNDLNRRDVLKKIDSQRQTHTNIPSAKVQDFGSSNRLPVKKEASVFSNKPVTQGKVPVNEEASSLKSNSEAPKKIVKQESITPSPTDTTSVTVSAGINKKEHAQRKEINNQALIDKTIEDIINRAAPVKSQQDNSQDLMNETLNDLQSKDGEKPKSEQLTGLDEIEMKMNELHGIECAEKLFEPRPHNTGLKKLAKSEPQKVSANKQSKVPNLLPFSNKQQRGIKENIFDIDSKEEVIEHEPITGDMDYNKKNVTKLPITDRQETITLMSADNSKREAIITEKDFDKFVRRNSISYENCLTVNFDSKEPHNVVQTVVQKDAALKTYSKHEPIRHDTKITSLKHEAQRQNVYSKPTQNSTKIHIEHNEENTNKNYPSKVKMAYQTAMTAKRQLERPITIIEDKPVKVVFMDSSAEYVPRQLNAHGKELSPDKKQSSLDLSATSTSDSLDSDTLDLIDDAKSHDETKLKTKHQRKQVLTPVETPELELIEPNDLGIEVFPKKKRKTEDKLEKNPKSVVPKKSYLLGRAAPTEDPVINSYNVTRVFEKEPLKHDNNTHISHKNTASAIDNLVKAAELLETQSENVNKIIPVVQNSDSQLNTPVKRGRGRPRKYPIPEGAGDKTIKVPSPQKKPRLAEVSSSQSIKNKDTDDDDDESSDGELKIENWTMGKINENIVCPICKKLFRSENVVFKHVKHCTGPSPNRSDSDNRSPRRFRESQDFETKSNDSKSDEMDVDDDIILRKDIRKKRRSRDTHVKSSTNATTNTTKDDIIIIEDTPLKSKPEKRDELKHIESRKSTVNKTKVSDKVTNLVCEFCGKTFRQLSYLANHKLQHEKEDAKKNETEAIKTAKAVFSCEVCKKEFRKLHHLVQHRIIHNPGGSSLAKLLRKSSSEQTDNKASKDQNVAKQSDDASAGFRCEPCDKSFRKLHHLVEHRETHDGINRQKNTSTVPTLVEKPQPPPQCDICKKTFRRLHHLIEHKEQHNVETGSDKSDDKSIKSSLSTRDIIHECPLCYMVFPNEHSLTKHTVFCQKKKKRQSAAKQSKQTEGVDNNEEEKITGKFDDDIEKDNDVIIVAAETVTTAKDEKSSLSEEPIKPDENKNDKVIPAAVNTIDLATESPKVINASVGPESKTTETKKEPEQKLIKELPNLPEKAKKPEAKEANKVQFTLKKKTPAKDKVAPTVTKRHKPNVPLPVVDDVKPTESSDDEEIRYMLNPDYKVDEISEGKLFMKVRAAKRNSLQIERPNYKDLIKRRISLQHPPKVPRLKPKPIPIKAATPTVAAASIKYIVKTAKLESVPSTDSDDSDVKYSFPVTENISKPNVDEPPSKEAEKKVQRKSLAEKRKSLSSIAKRKSLGKAIGAKHKAKSSPLKPVKRRLAEAEHRCDCGQLFSSAALLSRHTTLAHTPPRIRRRRDSPPPPPPPPARKATALPVKPARKSSVKTDAQPAQPARKSSVKADAQPAQPARKSSVKADAQPAQPARKSSVKADAQPAQPAVTRKSTGPKTPETRKSLKTSDRTDAMSGASDAKVRRYAAHKGVPVPEKMRKLIEKSKK